MGAYTSVRQEEIIPLELYVVTGDKELRCGCLGMNLGPLQEQHMLSTTELFL